MLATEGLIRILPWKGAVVRGYSSKEILDVVQCRVALETLAMRLAYANMGEELTRRIAEELEQADLVRALVAGGHGLALQTRGETEAEMEEEIVRARSFLGEEQPPRATSSSPTQASRSS